MGVSLTRRRTVGSPILAINAQGSLTAAASTDGGIAIWQTLPEDQPPRELARLVHEGPYLSKITSEYPVAFSPAGEWLISGGNRLERWDVGAGAEYNQLHHEAEVLAVASSRDGRYVGTTTADGFVHIWNTTDWRRLRSLQIRKGGEDKSTPHVVFSGDNRWVAATSGNALKVFSTDGWSEVTRKEYDHSLSWIAFSPDAHWVIATGIGAESNTVDVLGVGSWRVVPTLTHKRIDTKPLNSSGERNSVSISFSPELNQPIYSESISPGGDRLLTMTKPYCLEAELFPGIAHIWRITNGERAPAHMTQDIYGKQVLPTASIACK
jgi:WD40 repeat protein